MGDHQRRQGAVNLGQYRFLNQCSRLRFYQHRIRDSLIVLFAAHIDVGMRADRFDCSFLPRSFESSSSFLLGTSRIFRQEPDDVLAATGALHSPQWFESFQ